MVLIDWNRIYERIQKKVSLYIIILGFMVTFTVE